MGTSTLNAFFARGIDNITAQSIISLGHNLNSLKKMSKDELILLNLPEEVIFEIHSESRPPIPTNIVIKLLYESKRVCCICRDSSKSIIIHHIDEWHKTKDHSEDNLVVLCLQHHDEAHTKKELSNNLTKNQIVNFKSKWLSDVKTQDSNTILGLANNQSRWDYINIRRVFELHITLKIKYEDIRSFPILKSKNIVDESGIPKEIDDWKIGKKPSWHYCDFGDGIYFGDYLSSIIERIIAKLPLIDLTNNLNISFIKSVVKPGSFITGQLGFFFKDVNKFLHVDGILNHQLRKAYYQGNSIKIEFVFDARECTSSSGRFDALTGHRLAMPIIYVRSILEDSKKNLVISGSCLAIGTWFTPHRIDTK